jgi:hypothetical protein
VPEGERVVAATDLPARGKAFLRRRVRQPLVKLMGKTRFPSNPARHNI